MFSGDNRGCFQGVIEGVSEGAIEGVFMQVVIACVSSIIIFQGGIASVCKGAG